MDTKLDLESIIRINASSVLAPTDIDILNLLYGPLLKEEACHIYLAMYSLLNRINLEGTFTLKELIDILNTNKKVFMDSKRKLEALNLVQTHVSEDNFLLLLKAPLSAKQFLTDGVLGMYLYSMVGDTSFKALQKLFEIPRIDKTSYQEISASFDDVFETRVDTNVKTSSYLMDKRVNKGIIIKNEKFDFENFKNGISSTFLDGKRFSKKFQKYITDIAYAYNFDEAQMSELYNASISKSSGYFDYQACSKNALAMYKKLHEDKTPELQTKETEQNETYSTFNSLTAFELISGIIGEKPSANSLKHIENFYHNHEEIDRAILNIIVAYSVKKCDDKVPTLNYFEKVFEDWSNKGELTFENVMKYLSGDDKEQKQYKSRKKHEEVPEWLEEYRKHFNEGVEDL